MIYVRGNHPYVFRSGKWAHLFHIAYDPEGREMWVVEFPDGVKDVWPSWDKVAEYEVKIQTEPMDGFGEEHNGNGMGDTGTSVLGHPLSRG